MQRKKAQDLGLGVNAGHDLNLDNLAKFCTIPGILEVSIGHALTAEALEMGFANTVKEYDQNPRSLCLEKKINIENFLASGDRINNLLN